MPLPTSADLQKLDWSYGGAPFVQIAAKDLNTANLDWSYLGAPFVAVSTGTAPPVVSFKPIILVI